VQGTSPDFTGDTDVRRERAATQVFTRSGLRVLVAATRVLSVEEYMRLHAAFSAAEGLVTGRDERVAALCAETEQDMTVIGVACHPCSCVHSTSPLPLLLTYSGDCPAVVVAAGLAVAVVVAAVHAVAVAVVAVVAVAIVVAVVVL